MNVEAAHHDRLFSLLYAAYFRSTVRYIHRFIGDLDCSEEVAQDVFIRVYEHLDEISPYQGNVKYYIFRIARNLAIDTIRKRRVESKKFREIVLEEVALNEQFYRDIENCYIEGEIISTLHDTINAFPDDEKEIFIDRNIRNMAFVDICDSTGISFYKMQKIEQMMKEKIKRVLAPYYNET